MIPIHSLLSRIRWDKEFGRGQFEIGYYDRVRDEILRIPLAEIIFPDESGLIRIMDQEGVFRSIPLHRIKEVFKDNQLIWQRKSPPAISKRE